MELFAFCFNVGVRNSRFAVAMMHMSSWWSIFSTFAVRVCYSLLFVGSVGWS